MRTIKRKEDQEERLQPIGDWTTGSPREIHGLRLNNNILWSDNDDVEVRVVKFAAMLLGRKKRGEI